MKKLAILAIVIILPLVVTMAQDKSGDIRRLMAVMQMDKTVDNMMNSMQNAMKQQATMQIQGDSAKEKSREEIIEKSMDFIMTEMTAITKKMIDEDLPTVYEKFFTHGEIKDLIQFYESPTGKKLLEITPEMSVEIMSLLTTKYMPTLNQKMKELMSELTLGSKQ
ncbi:DUF2059 domain-containing protein [uncultured Proteiniphilum sp.]|uniref:DUF2059 domain-containing protein n=1 Tax=uncultured Proteiniphilum sp. TaxID=497637 RepID=UPI002602D67C|nr:DUF2059 domain-containing protein [uncultured Proteiniphilum sp.]